MSECPWREEGREFKRKERGREWEGGKNLEEGTISLIPRLLAPLQKSRGARSLGTRLGMMR